MTRQQAVTLSDVLWKILTPILFALCSFLANEINTRQQKILNAIDGINSKMSDLQIEQAVYKEKLDTHLRMIR